GVNLLSRWRRVFSSDSDLQIEGYYDRTKRIIPTQFVELRNTVSGSVKYRQAVERHDLLVGIDGLVSWDEIGNIGFAVLEPARRTMHNVGAFAQDTIALGEHHALTLGVKLDHNSFSGFEYQPTARFAWTPSDLTTVWTAVSRAVRTP